MVGAVTIAGRIFTDESTGKAFLCDKQEDEARLEEIKEEDQARLEEKEEEEDTGAPWLLVDNEEEKALTPLLWP